MSEEQIANVKPDEPKAVGAEIFARQQDPVVNAPEGTVLVLPGPRPVYLNKDGALAWIDLQIERCRRKASDPDYGENLGAVTRLQYLMKEREKLDAARGKIRPRLVDELAHPETPVR